MIFGLLFLGFIIFIAIFLELFMTFSCIITKRDSLNLDIKEAAIYKLNGYKGKIIVKRKK